MSTVVVGLICLRVFGLRTLMRVWALNTFEYFGGLRVFKHDREYSQKNRKKKRPYFEAVQAISMVTQC